MNSVEVANKNTNAVFTAIVNGFDAYLSTFGIGIDNKYVYYSYLTNNITNSTNVTTALNDVFMQNSDNVIANFDIHFDAYESYYRYWCTTGSIQDFESVDADYLKNANEGNVGTMGKRYSEGIGFFSSMRLFTNQNAYTGNAVDKNIRARKYSYLGKRLTLDDFNEWAKKDSKLQQKIKELNENGERVLAANVTYELSAKWVATGYTFKEIATDNVYSSPDATGIWHAYNTTYDTTKADVYKYGASQGNSEPINVYSPIYVNPTVTTSISLSENSKVPVSKFSMTFSNQNPDATKYYGVLTEKKTKNVYFVKFAFDIYDIKYKAPGGEEKRIITTVKADTWIGPLTEISASVSGFAMSDEEFDSAYNVLAIQNTLSNTNSDGSLIMDSLTNKLMQYKGILENVDLANKHQQFINSFSESKEGTELVEKLDNVCADELYNDNNALSLGTYYIYAGSIAFQMQIYDFKVTDVSDPSWKSTFRNADGYSHSGRAYYSGISRWNYAAIYEDEDTENTTDAFVGREQSQLGDFSNNILPIGPYKNSKLTYAYAPKLGYTISFDVKVAGIYNKNNAVRITPKFYFLKKDGTAIIEDILLFYKNSEGKYVQIGSDSDKYEISFMPNDPYRLKEESTKKYLSSKTVSLGKLTELYLNANESATSRTIVTQGYNGSVTTYYGEYKLPNTTIAVKVDSEGKYNINEPLTNGYIGVIFDMSAGSKKTGSYEESTSYDSGDGGIWKLEQYFGGKTEFKLQNGVVELKEKELNPSTNKYEYTDKDSEKAKQMIGTVILYDADARASDDYN